GSSVGEDGGYIAADFGPLRRFTLAGADGAELPAQSADMELEREEGRYHSAMAMLIDRMYYVKGRYIVEAGVAGRDEARQALEAFMAALVAGTYIGSTGSCWSPAPIEGHAAGAGEP